MDRKKQRGEGMREAFEEALSADPDDRANHAAYADWLSEQADEKDRTRGEFVAVQLALEDESLRPGERQRLRHREAELLAAHEREWLGGLAPFLLDGEMNTCDAQMNGFDDRFPVFAHTRPPWLPEGEAWAGGNQVQKPTFCYRYGWLDRLHLPHLSIHSARALKQAQQASLLSELMIDEVAERSSGISAEDCVPDGEHLVGLWPLTKATTLANVRTFRLGPDNGYDYRNYRCYTHTGAVVEVVRQMPRLEELYLFANGFDVSELFRSPTLSCLRILQLYHCSQVHRLQLLADNPAYRNLTHLLLHPHNVGAWPHNSPDAAAGYRPVDGFLPLSVVAALLHSPNLPRLQHLRLRCSSMGDAGCQEIVNSGILKRLKSLDLRHGAVTDEGSRILAACPDLRNLMWLDLDRNRLNAAGIARLNQTGIPLRIDDQQSRRERATLAGNAAEYLREGEWE